MQLGLSTYTFPWAIGVEGYTPTKPLSAAELLQYAAMHNIRYIQIADNMPLHTFSSGKLQELKQLADKLNINIQVGTRGLKAENMMQYLGIAKMFQSPFLRVVIDNVGYHPNEDEVIRIIRTLTPHFQEAGVCLAIENHDRFPSVVLQRIIQQTSGTGICLDTANSLGGNEGVHEVMRVLGPSTINLHIKDITIQRLSHKMGFTIQGCAAGDGIINIPATVEELKNYNKCESITLEVWSQPANTVEETIAIEKAWVEKSIDYLKNFLK